MRSSAAVTRSLRSGLCLLAFTTTLVAACGAVHAQCVGDCTGTGLVTITDLILGVNIVLELQPPAACPAFQNAAGQVDIAQLVKGVNIALGAMPVDACPSFDAKGDGAVTINELIAAVNRALTGCVDVAAPSGEI